MSKEQPAQPPRKRRFRTLLIIASILAIGACGIAVKSFWPARVPNHSPLIRIVNFPGVEKPVFREQSKMKMAANAEIAGFVIDGKPYAFVLAAMNAIDKHVVNMNIDNKAVSVTYCDLSRCVRVLKQDGTSEPLQLGVGGMATKNRLVLMFEGERYDHDSTNLPLQDVEFEKTTWSDWMARHPDTVVYSGATEPKPDKASTSKPSSKTPQV